MDTSSRSFRGHDREMFRGSNNCDPQTFEIGSDAIDFTDEQQQLRLSKNSHHSHHHHPFSSFESWFVPTTCAHVSTPSSYGGTANDSNDSQQSLPPLEDVVKSEPDLENARSSTPVKISVGIDDDLQMILDLDPGIVDLGSTPTTEPKIVGLPPLAGGYYAHHSFIFIYSICGIYAST